MIIYVVNRRLYCVLMPCMVPSLSEIAMVGFQTAENAIENHFFLFPNTL